jgi:hypothetical protein
MAYIDFSETAAAPALDRAVPQLAKLVAEHASAFSPLEERVLQLSHHDGLDTLRPQPKRSWLGRIVLGPQPPARTLANDRLEALRRLAVEARHYGWHVRSSAIAAAKRAGFSETQIGRVIDTIGHSPKLAQRTYA